MHKLSQIISFWPQVRVGATPFVDSTCFRPHLLKWAQKLYPRNIILYGRPRSQTKAQIKYLAVMYGWSIDKLVLESRNSCQNTLNFGKHSILDLLLNFRWERTKIQVNKLPKGSPSKIEKGKVPTYRRNSNFLPDKFGGHGTHQLTNFTMVLYKTTFL